jgi:hypothetical protein
VRSGAIRIKKHLIEARKEQVKDVKIALSRRLEHHARFFQQIIGHERARDAKIFVKPEFSVFSLRKPTKRASGFARSVQVIY